MEYKLEKSKRKSISIQVKPNGEILVKAPINLSLKLINDFVLSKEKWINSHKRILLDEKEKYKDFIDLNKIVVFGEELHVLDDGTKYMFGNYEIKHNKNSNKKLMLKKFLNELANNYITQRTNELSKSICLNFSTIKIISARKKWGSCNSKKELKFNYTLVMLPKNLIDYVICHELCHLVELNHSDRFWNLMLNLGFNKKTIRQQMKQYGFVLNMF